MTEVDNSDSEERVERIARQLSQSGSGYTVIAIPHDIDQRVAVAMGGESILIKFDGIALKDAIYRAERKRLDGEYERVSKRLKSTILPEEEEVVNAGD